MGGPLNQVVQQQGKTSTGGSGAQQIPVTTNGAFPVPAVPMIVSSNSQAVAMRTVPQQSNNPNSPGQ